MAASGENRRPLRTTRQPSTSPLRGTNSSQRHTYTFQCTSTGIIGCRSTLANGDLNAFYGSGSWIGPHSDDAFEVVSQDHGIGVSHLTTENTGHNWVESVNLLGSSDCAGVECRPTYDPIYGYNSKMPEGEDALTSTVEDAMGLKETNLLPAV